MFNVNLEQHSFRSILMRLRDGESTLDDLFLLRDLLIHQVY
jgi:hypothetical protein